MAADQPAKSGNALHVIRPYRLDPLWVFDDARYGLSQEPFVTSATSLLDGMTQRVLGRRVDACTLLFSAAQFPDAQFHLRRVRLGDDLQGGAYYECDQWPGQEGWLCPATLHYFPNGYPENVWLQVLAGPTSS